tara:strand:+ start:35 stop:1174 length:1140 start_codon:yes stop_codon:yes gene_type:complete
LNLRLEIGESIDILTSPTDEYCVVIYDTNHTNTIRYMGYSQSEFYFKIYQERARGFTEQLNPYSGNFMSKELKFNGLALGQARIIIGKSPLHDSNDPSSFIPHVVTLTTKMEHGETLLMANVFLADDVDLPTENLSISRTETLQLKAFAPLTASQKSTCNSSNTSPDIIPPSANLNANIRRMGEIKSHAESAGVPFYVSSAFLINFFYNSVRNGSVMDYKQLGPQYAEFGNYNYGAIGRALGIPSQVLKRGAGWAQIQAGTSDDSYGHYLGFAPYGDDPADQVQIGAGIDYYDSVFSESSESERLNAGKNGITDFCNDTHNDEDENDDSEEEEHDNGNGYDGDNFSTGPGDYYIPGDVNFCQYGFCSNNFCVGYVKIVD